MALPLIHFRYFDSPEKFGFFLEEETACELCGNHTKCFDGSAFIGAEAIEAVCFECLISGRLKDLEIATCQGDTVELRTHLQLLHPQASAREIDKLVKKRTDELETTTPPVITWQDWEWPCADGDYCTFIGYGSKELYNELSADKNGFELFESSIYYTQEDETDAHRFWKENMPAQLITNIAQAEELSVLFYVFKSLHSNRIITIWDIE